MEDVKEEYSWPLPLFGLSCRGVTRLLLPQVDEIFIIGSLKLGGGNGSPACCLFHPQFLVTTVRIPVKPHSRIRSAECPAPCAGSAGVFRAVIEEMPVEVGQVGESGLVAIAPSLQKEDLKIGRKKKTCLCLSSMWCLLVAPAGSLGQVYRVRSVFLNKGLIPRNLVETAFLAPRHQPLQFVRDGVDA